MARENATSPRWLNPAEMKAWRRYIVASRRLLEALDLDLAEHELSMADYEILARDLWFNSHLTVVSNY